MSANLDRFEHIQRRIAREAASHQRGRCYRPAMTLVMLLMALAWMAADGRWHAVAVAAPPAQSAPARTLAIVNAEGARLYAAPDGEVRATLMAGTILTAFGRTADGLWIVVQTPDNLSGWIQSSGVMVYGMEELPVMLYDSEPTAAPTPSVQPVNAITATPVAAAAQTAAPQNVAMTEQSGGIAQTPMVAVVRTGDVSFYDRPDGTPFLPLTGGMALTAWARTEDNNWLLVRNAEGVTGWVPTDTVVIANIAQLPVQAGDAVTVVTPIPTSVPDAAATPEAAQTPAAPETPAAPGPSTTASPPTATVIQIDSRLNVRSGPGLEHTIIGKALPGDTFEINGRNLEATWIHIKTPISENGLAWVFADYVTLSVPVLGLAVTEVATPVAPVVETPADKPIADVTIADIGCTTDQIIRWNEAQGSWVCSNDLTALQAQITAMQAEIEALRAELDRLVRELELLD